MTEQRLIDANELLTAFPCGETVRTECVRATIGHMPTIEERKMGKWIQETKHYKDSEQEFYYYEERCSECGTKRKIGWAEARYCPMCGARMQGMEGEEDDVD